MIELNIKLIAAIGTFSAAVASIIVGIITVRNQRKTAKEANENSIKLLKEKAETDLLNELAKKKFDYQVDRNKKLQDLSFDLRKQKIDYVNGMLKRIYSLRTLGDDVIESKFNYEKLSEFYETFESIKEYYKQQTPVVNIYNSEMRNHLHGLKKKFGLIRDFIMMTEDPQNSYLSDGDVEADKEFLGDLKEMLEGGQFLQILDGVLIFENYLRELSKSEYEELNSNSF